MFEERMKLRDEIIFKENEVLEPGGGIHRFQNLDISQLFELVNEHLADLTVAQNEGPDIKTFFNYGRTDNIGFKRTIFYEGYVYTSVYDRADLSPTIDGIREVIDANNINGLIKFVDNFRTADEFSIKMFECNGKNKLFMRAWWD